MSINKKKTLDDDNRYIPREEMIDFITNNAETASYMTLRLMYEFFKCAIDDEANN